LPQRIVGQLHQGPAPRESTRVILGHADPRTVERHYNQARAVEASRAYQEALARRRGG
jgi:hypothetical protein